MAQRQKKNPALPDMAYIVRRDDPRVVVIVANGDIGFYPVHNWTPDRVKGTSAEQAEAVAQAFAARMNERLGVNPDQARAMEAASMFGWHIPMVAEILEGRA
jgi:hypothetical protein